MMKKILVICKYYNEYYIFSIFVKKQQKTKK